MGLFSKTETEAVTPGEDSAVKIAPASPVTKSPLGGKPISPAVAQLISPAPASVPDGAPRSVNTAPLSERQIYFQQLTVKIHQKLVERLDVQNMRSMPPETVRGAVLMLV